MRKAYEEKLQQVEASRADLERRMNQIVYDLDVRDSEMNRISNVGKTVADELQFVTNESHERKQIIEYLEAELSKANNEFMAAKQETEELRKVAEGQSEVI